MCKLKIGVVSTRNEEFFTDLNERFDRTMAGMKKLAEKWDFDLYIAEQKVYCEEDATAAVKECEANGVDFLMVQLTSCPGNGGTWIHEFTKIRAGLGVWAIPEEANEGPSPVNSFVGMTFYAGIIGHYNLGRDVKYKWFYGNPEDEIFIKRFSVTVKAFQVIKKMNHSKVALVSGVSEGFGDLVFDERNVKRVFPGIKLSTHNEYRAIKEKALAYSDEEVKSVAEAFVNDAKGIDKDCCKYVDISTRIYMAYKEYILENNIDAIALNCIYKLGEDFGIHLCSIISKLCDDGFVVSCEGDFMGAISMLMLKYLTGNVPSLMDFPQFDEDDNSILMWHCGATGNDFVCDNCYTWEKSYSGEPIVRDLDFKEGHVTIARLSGESDQLMVLDGDVIPGKKSFLGSGGWIENLKMNGKDISALDFVNTILVQKFHHHYPIVFGNVAKELSEIAAWLDLKPITKVEYEDYFQNKVY